jgi:hypothetical protein
MPDAFSLDLRIEAEGRGSGGRKPHLDEIAIVIAREP